VAPKFPYSRDESRVLLQSLLVCHTSILASWASRSRRNWSSIGLRFNRLRSIVVHIRLLVHSGCRCIRDKKRLGSWLAQVSKLDDWKFSSAIDIFLSHHLRPIQRGSIERRRGGVLAGLQLTSFDRRRTLRCTRRNDTVGLVFRFIILIRVRGEGRRGIGVRIGCCLSFYLVVAVPTSSPTATSNNARLLGGLSFGSLAYFEILRCGGCGESRHFGER
jgi:hypothetical protein